MLFNKETILFNINSVPVIGNFDTGSLIGLTESGKAFCDKIINSGIEIENVEPENLELFQALCVKRDFSRKFASINLCLHIFMLHNVVICTVWVAIL